MFPCMKLDIDYTKNILDIIANATTDRVSLGYIMKKIGVRTKDTRSDIERLYGIQKNDVVSPDAFSKLRGHISILCKANFITSNNPDNGFAKMSDNYDSGTYYELTLSGNQILEALNNDTIEKKILKGVKDVGISTLKSIPSLAIQIIAQHFSK